MTVYNIVPVAAVSTFVKEHHYSHGHHRAPKPCIAAYEGGRLIGVLMFCTPASEAVRAKVFGPEFKDRVIELHRLVMLDEAPKNSESALIGASLKLLMKTHPEKRAVISFADPTEGHRGVIYQATNFVYTGKSAPATFYLDASGRLHHPRQCGVNIRRDEAAKRGWTATKRLGKHRYIIMVGPPAERRLWRKRLRFQSLPYPKDVDHNSAVEVSTSARGASNAEDPVKLGATASPILPTSIYPSDAHIETGVQT